jgi:hypothetical protein
MWLYQLMPEGEDAVSLLRMQVLGSVFTLQESAYYTFPDPSLALSSALGNIFLPFIHSSDFEHDKSSLSQSGRFCLFFAALLKQHPHLVAALESHEDINPMTDLMYFLLLHATFVKDKLALPSANDLWTEKSAVGEADFMQFQIDCVELLERVLFPVFPQSDFRYLCPLLKKLYRCSKMSQGRMIPLGITLPEFSVISFRTWRGWMAWMLLLPRTSLKKRKQALI